VNWCQQIKKVPIEALDEVVPLLQEEVSKEAWSERRDFFLEPVKEVRANKEQSFDQGVHGGGGLKTRAELGDMEPEEKEEEENTVTASAANEEDGVEIPLGPHASPADDEVEIPPGPHAPKNVQRTSADTEDSDEPPAFEDEGKTASEETPPGEEAVYQEGGEPEDAPPSVTRTKKKGSKKKSAKKSSKKGSSKGQPEKDPGGPEPDGPTIMIVSVLDQWCQVLEFEGAPDANALMESAHGLRSGILAFHEERLEALEEDDELGTEEGQQVATIVDQLINEKEYPTRIFRVAAEFRTQVVTTLQEV
jgi:hypothetical protein